MSANTKIQWAHRKAVVGFPSYAVTPDGLIRGPRGKILRPGGKQRAIVALYEDGKPHAKQVSHVVLEAFVGPPPFAGACALHANDDAWDNRLENLRWGTHVENKEDERRNRGRVSGRPRILAGVADENLFAGSSREAARVLGSSHNAVLAERRRRRGC